jgi:ABC-type amino acid transport system permease subunit
MVVAAEWDSLEIAKLAVAALTPIFLFVLGFIVTRATKRVEEAQWMSHKLIERRLDLFEEMAPLLNDLFCFFLLVGRFRPLLRPKLWLEKESSMESSMLMNRSSVRNSETGIRTS